MGRSEGTHNAEGGRKVLHTHNAEGEHKVLHTHNAEGEHKARPYGVALR